LTDNGEASIKIINLLGEVIFENRMIPSQKKINLDLTTCNEGIYFVEVKSGGKECIKKIILTK
jgi:hypothetical protein